MQEVELKFQIPLSHQKKLYQLFLAKDASPISLYAQYYDTPEHHLAKNNMSLRLRLEGTHWIQTLKASSHHHLERFELEVDLGALKKPILDLEIYQSYPQAKERLQHTLGKQAKNLIMQFETDVNRLVHVIHDDHTEIEVSLDRGEIRHDQQKLGIYEIEFELKKGTIQDLIKYTEPWIKEYHLWLDVRSKAQRGDFLAQNLELILPQLATILQLDQSANKDSALKKIVNNCLQHLLPNTTAIAGEHYNSEHIHQTRVAIRRLRSALHVFGDWSSAADPNWQEQLATLFRQLGSTRDRDAITESILPQLQQAGAPAIQLPRVPEDDDSISIAESLRSPDFTYLILALLQFVHQPTERVKKSNLKKDIVKKLQKLHQQICQDADQFLELDVASRHRTRKRLKRLRYCVEFIAALYPNKKVKNYLQSLKPAQESLGQYNDLMVAESMFQNIVKHKQKVWFALGWIANEKQYVVQRVQKDLDNFSKTEPFW